MTGPGTTTRWRVLSWNVLGAKEPNLELVAEVVESYAPDVLALQEVRRHQARHLARRLRWQVRWTRKHYPYSPAMWWRAEGEAVLAPASLSHAVRTTLSPGVSTWNWRHRVALGVTVARGDDALRVYCTHLSSDSADDRITQARRLVEVVEADGAPVAIVAGDLNAPDEPEVLREFHPVGLRDAGGEWTSPSIKPMQRIDYVLVPERATVIDRSTPEGGQRWHELSDHLPTLVEFEV